MLRVRLSVALAVCAALIGAAMRGRERGAPPDFAARIAFDIQVANARMSPASVACGGARPAPPASWPSYTVVVDVARCRACLSEIRRLGAASIMFAPSVAIVLPATPPALALCTEWSGDRSGLVFAATQHWRYDTTTAPVQVYEHASPYSTTLLRTHPSLAAFVDSDVGANDGASRGSVNFSDSVKRKTVHVTSSPEP
jgi:hypothetical protein